MKWASAVGQKGNVINLRKPPRCSAGLFSCFGSLKERKTNFFLTVQFKRKTIPFFSLFLFRQFGKWEDHLRQCFFLGSSASLACPEIRSRGAAGNSGEVSPSTMYHPLCFTHTHTRSHAQTHYSLQLQCEWVCNPPIPNPEQPQHEKNKTKAFLWLELSTKKNE